MQYAVNRPVNNPVYNKVYRETVDALLLSYYGEEEYSSLRLSEVNASVDQYLFPEDRKAGAAGYLDALDQIDLLGVGVLETLRRA